MRKTRSPNEIPAFIVQNQTREGTHFIHMAQKSNTLSAFKLPDQLAVFPLRDTVVFPAVPAQLSSTRSQTIQMVFSALESKTPIGLVTLRRETDSPDPEDLHQTGTAATIERAWHLPDGSIRFLVHSLCRIDISEASQSASGLRIRPLSHARQNEPAKDLRAMVQGVSGQFQQILSLTPHLPDELLIAVLNIHDPDHLSDFIAFHLNIGLSEKQALLDEYDPSVRLDRLARIMSQELEVLELGVRVRSTVQLELDRSRREHLIREQIKALQIELGQTDSRSIEIESLKTRLRQNNLPSNMAEEASREIDRLSRMSFAAPEYTASHTYLDWVLDLPWTQEAPQPIDLRRARTVLDEDHKGLDQVKERILDDLAVRMMTGRNNSTVLCLVGPPGVGKTSIGQSIARATNRPFARVALGGLRDEAELRGHRRTYVGALPGRIIQCLRRAGSRDPVILLDEIDKLGAQGSGDPAGVLLEILDPNQNHAFTDHYLNMPFDLSQVLFITTANVAHNIPNALLDRLELITLSGYLDSEKADIVRSHILPRQLAIHGLRKQHLKMSPKTVRYLISNYTQEPGLRQLERLVGVICRRIARSAAEGVKSATTVSVCDLENFLGLPSPVDIPSQHVGTSGVVTGLAATPMGGQHFSVETTTMPGTGGLILTGHLGEILKESAQTAVSYVRTHSPALGVPPGFLQDIDIHIHAPAGAIAKDGPSAGLAIAFSLISHLTEKKISQEIAITGEITLTGRVLRVGAIRDKLLAAQRARISQIILPEANRSEVEALPKEVSLGLRLHFVDTILSAGNITFKETTRRGR
ncbi:MAG: endopeptidase La [bacterium]|nr:endopeptidase La [bacterium]